MTNYLNPSTRSGGVDQIVVPARATAIPVDDAPFDDEQYVRINGEWVPYDAPPIIPDTLAPKPPTDLSGSGLMAGNGTSVDYELEWTAPTQNTDDSPLADFAYYVLRWRYAGLATWVSLTTNETSYLLPGLLPGTDIEWEVLARDYSGNDSTWASDTVPGVTDTAGPAKPSAPTLTSQLGTVVATWDGLANGGGAMSADFARLDIYMSATTGGPWSFIGSLTGPGAVVVASIPVGATRFFSSIAVDTSNNASDRSTEANIVVQGVEIPDIDTTVFDSIDSDIAIAKAEAEATAVDYTQARGTDHITNGTGVMGDATNFDYSFTFNGTDAPVGCSGSFYAKNTFAFGAMTDEFQPYDPAKSLRLSFQMRQTLAGAVSKAYGFLAPHDGGGNAIGPQHYMYITGTQTTLALPLNPGDTTITLTSSANWYGSAAKPAGAASYFRSIQFWDWVDVFGKAWPAATYTRNVLGSNQYADGGIVGNVITLLAPYAGPAKAAGTPVSQPSAGGAYIYMPSLTNGVVPEAWTTYADTHAGGIFPSASQAVPSTGGAVWATGMPPATAKVKVGWLLNYPPTTGRHAIAAVSLSDASAANHSANNITSVQITDNAVTAPKIQANAVIADKIAAGAVTADKILAGAVVAGKLAAGAVEAGTIAAGAVLADNIAANAITANMINTGVMSAAMTITGYLLAGNPTGTRVVIDGQGIRQYDDTGTLLTNIPTDPDQPATFEGAMIADSITIKDFMSLQGLANKVARGAVLTLEGGTSSPSAAPSVAVSYPTYQPPSFTSEFLYIPVGHNCDVDDSDNIVGAKTFYGYGKLLGRAGKYWIGAQYTDSAGGTRTKYGNMGSATVVAVGGAERLIVSCVYTTGNGATPLGRITSLDPATMTNTGSVEPTLKAQLNSKLDDFVFYTRLGRVLGGLTGTQYPERLAMGMMNWNSTVVETGKITLRQYTVTDNVTLNAGFSLIGGTEKVITSPLASGESLIGVTHGRADKLGYQATTGVLVTDFIWLVHGSVKTYAYLATTMARVTDYDFDTPPGAKYMNAWGDPITNSFIGFRTTEWDDDKPVTKMTNNHWVGATSSKWWISSTNYDSNVTGGTHQSTQGPRVSLTMKKRAGLTITVPPYPVRPSPTTTDDPLSAKIYIGRGAADPTRANMEYAGQTDDPNRTLLVGNFTPPTGAAVTPPPVAGDFPASSAAQLVSGTAGWSLVGDGTATVGGLSHDSAGVTRVSALQTTGSNSRTRSPGCMVRKTDAPTVPNTTYTLLNFSGHYSALNSDTTVWDTGQPSRFYAPVSGRYSISGCIAFNTNTTGYRIAHVRRNSGGVIGGGSYVMAWTCAPVTGTVTSLPFATTDIELAAGEYLEIFVNQASGGALGVGSFGGIVTTFSMSYVGNL